jgi:hypothetical protein
MTNWMMKGLGAAATKRLSVQELRQYNRAMSRNDPREVWKEEMRHRNGEFAPFGVGAAIGGAANYIMRAVARHSDKFFPVRDVCTR